MIVLPKLRSIKLRVLVLAVSSLGSGVSVEAAGPALPVPCVASACGTRGASQFVTAGSATAISTQNTLKVNQTSSSAILNWSSFNIGSGGSVVFQQPSTSSIALNRIFQSSPTQIFGRLQANGQIYLLNLNGFLFGPSAVVNVGSLLVSSLPLALADSNFGNGILSPLENDKAVFDATLDPLAPGVGRTVVLDSQGNPVHDAQGNTIPVQVVVQPGAQVTAADQGRVLLAGQNVTSGGTLTAPDGQVVLAAGAKVYLQADTDPNLRGLIVEVDQGGTAWNQLTGTISVPRGNATLVGFAVNQDGRISATTSVSANGSVRLEAAQSAVFGGTSGAVTVASSKGGKLTIGPQSQIDIEPELASSATEVPAQAQLPSSVSLLGEQVIIQGGSISAPGGTLTAIAAANPSPAAADPAGGVTNTYDPNARLRIDAGASIDLSGSDASLPVTANLVSAQLRSNELADDPTQRNGPLHGATVYIDARQGSPLIANLSSEIAAVPQNVAQRTENGGKAVFQSEGDVVFASGASLNVSGGSTTYSGGVMQTSYLVGANGQLYPIATANPLLSYVGVVNPTFTQSFNRWGVQEVVPTPGLSNYQPGYVQGAPAGSVQFAAPVMALEGNLRGSAVNGMYQRTPSTAVPGGQLIIGVPGGVSQTGANPPIDYLAPGVDFTRAPVSLVADDNTSLPQSLTLALPSTYLTNSGFTSTQIYSDFGVALPPGLPLSLPSGSTLTVNAARVDVMSSITDPGGALSFQNVYNVGSVATTVERPGVYVGGGVTLDVRGLWTNDMPAGINPGLSQTWQNGGSINLGVASAGSLLSIGSDVVLRASGGAWMNAAGKIVPGTGGSITLNSDAVDGGLDVGSGLAVDGFGVDGAAGGTFNLGAPRLEVSSGAGSWTKAQSVDDFKTPGGVFQVYSSLFSNYGFQNVNLAASGLVAPSATTSNVLTVDPGTTINAVVPTLLLEHGLSLQPSAANVTGLAAVATLAEYQRPAASVTFSALPPTGPDGAQNTATNGGTSAGDVFIGAGATITTDATGSIGLTSLDSIVVDGALRSPGGTVNMQIVSPLDNNSAYQKFEVGFLPTQRIELGATGTIDVSGTFVQQISQLPLDLGTAYSGGAVNLFADRGAVVADRGSLISIAGTSVPLDILQANGTFGHEVASTAGGSITVRSGESIFLDGSLQAGAGASGTSGTAAAGSLDIQLTRSEAWWGIAGSPGSSFTPFNPGPLTVEVVPQVAPVVGVPTLLFGNNMAELGAEQLAQSGLDALRIEAGGAVQFAGNVSVALGRQIIIDAPVIATQPGAQASLGAPYIEVGYDLTTNPTTPVNSSAATGGSGVVSFSGAEVDLVGATVFQGTSNVRFSSTGDLLLRGQAIGTGSTNPAGSVSVAGELALDAARIFPATDTSFAITASESTPGVASSVTIGQTSPDPGTPYSAGGVLSITADNISSTGSVYAPFGGISLNANTSLTLGNGNLTSVSGGGLTIPYGQTLFGGQEWLYASASGNQSITGVPSRSVNLTAPSVTITKQATIDLTGGGNLSAFEWVPGPGGSTDALAPGVTPGLYAILPSTRGLAAPQDPQDVQLSTISPGESIYLSGGGGLAAGSYPLLPARYALVPGALLIRVEPNLQSTTPGSLGTLADGTPVVAGYFSYGSTGLHQSPGYIGFAIYPGSYGGQLAEYDTSLASIYFSAAASVAGAPRPTSPADAGALSIAVTQTLNVAGQVRTAAASGGIAAPIEISANDLVVGTPTGPVPSDAVSISGSVLASWQPGSLLLGGTLTQTSGASQGSGTSQGTGTSQGNNGASSSATIDVLANTVTVGSGTSLSAGQIILVANQSIDVQHGATLQSTSAASSTAPSSLPAAQNVTLTNTAGGSPALLAVSDLNWLVPTSAGSASANAATVAVDAGASLGSRGSLSIAGPGGVKLNGNLTGSGAEWSLSSSSIAFVPAGSHADALAIGPALLAQLGKAESVALTSSGSIDVFTPVQLGIGSNGSPTLGSLTLAAASLNNDTAGPGTTQFGAQTLVLIGTGASTSPGVAGTTGANLSLTAGALDIGPGLMAINGFAATHATATHGVIGEGTGGLSVGGDLTLAAAGVTAATGAQTNIGASGTLAVTPVKGAATLPVMLGGELALSGGTVDISGNVAAPSGIVTIASVGALNVDSGALVSTAGRVVTIGNQSIAAPGGSIAIGAGTDLTISSGAALNVSGAGATAGSAAGTISLVAGGVATVTARLDGTGGAGASGGSFSLDAGTLQAPGGSAAIPLTGLATALGGGGFNDAVNLRVRSGDLTLAPGSVLAANEVSLTADTGTVLIGGEISTQSGALRGRLSLFGGAGVELAAGGALHADGVGSSGVGGTIEIGAGRLIADQSGVLDTYNNAFISLDSGSTITAAGPAANGTLLLRAPALTATSDIAINSFAANTSGLGQIIVEPVLAYNTATMSSPPAPSAADFQQVFQNVQTYMTTAAPAIATRLVPTGSTPLMVEAGVEIVAPGALTLQSGGGGDPALDLSTWRFNSAPVDLTVRAAGDLTVNNSLTDGFATMQVGTLNQPTLLAGPSSSIRLIAGADQSSANPFAVVAGGPGSLTLAPGAVVRTGTGDLDLIAAQDIVVGSNAGAYTAGVPAVAPGGTASDPYPNVPATLGTALPFGINISRTNYLMSFPEGGGNLLVQAGRDILGTTPDKPGVPGWELREGGTLYSQPGATSAQPVPPEWGVNLAAYNWNFGTLGGGDVRISAGRDALNVTAAAADSLLPQYGGGTQYVTGGGLTLTAGRDIGSAQVLVADGTGTVTAGGALTALPSAAAGSPLVGAGFYIQSGSLDVNARLGIDVDGVFNPTAITQPTGLVKSLIGSYFSYSDGSALNLKTVAGDVNLGLGSNDASILLGFTTVAGYGYGVLPGTLSVAALGGNILFGPGIGANGAVTLYPSSHGQLDLLAAQNITGTVGSVTMSDAVAGSYPTVLTPNSQTQVQGVAFAGDIHSADGVPALVTAGESIDNLTLSLPKAAQIIAGQDILDLSYLGQNLNATDQTLITAGRDFTFDNNYNGQGISLGGPGALDILAGRNITLGFSSGGVVTTGNLLNANLPTAQGADLTMVTGLGTNPDFTGFLRTIIAPSATYQGQLVSYVESLQGTSGLSFADAEAAFEALPHVEQQPLIDQVFFHELLLSGRAANSGSGAGFGEGYAAIDALFPGSRAGSSGAIPGSYAGDLTLTLSRIYTLSGGNISLLVPGGLLNVGLANTPPQLGTRSPSTLGIVAEGPGNVGIYSRGDVDVNSSRIFTLGGGNILIWSDEGNIDAGRGAKAAVSAPPPSILISSNGTVTLNFSGAAAGSGIRTIQTDPNTPPGNVDLIAPVGTVNAGDAGIGAAGDINIAARSVVGASNINFGGTATGVPSEVSNLGASLSSASTAGSSATTSATSSTQESQRQDQNAAAPLAQSTLSWLDVFVVGLGEENCKTEDVECLKRQKMH